MCCLEFLLNILKQIRDCEQADLTADQKAERLDVEEEFEREVCVEEMNEGVRIILLLRENKGRLITTLCAAAAAGKGE